MNLKDKMKDIWDNAGCVYPCHLACWSEYGNMNRKKGDRWWTRWRSLWATKGRPTFRIRKKQGRCF